MRTFEPITTTASSVMTSLRALAELEDERIAREREAILEVARAREAALAKRQEEDAARRRREDDERVAVTTAALERVRLEHQAAQDREADARRVADERLREATHFLASRARSSHLGALVRVAHGVATASLALAVVFCASELRDAHRAQAALASSLAADERALGEVRAENAELTRDYRLALEAARNAGIRSDPPTTPAPPTTAAPVPPVPSLGHHHESPPPHHIAARAGCDPHDPLCADLPER
jgi:hypothetical protein